MKPTDLPKFLELMQGVHAAYRIDLTEFIGQVWWQACQNFEMEQVSKALSAHLMDPDRGQYAPKIADMVRLLQGTKSDRSLMAWSKVGEAIQRIGAYTTVCFDDGLIHAAIEDIGGWIGLCQSQLDELPFFQKRFCDAYKAYAAQGTVTYPPSLPGIHALENGTNGFEKDKPTLIGDREKAEAVLASGRSAPRVQITSPARDPALAFTDALRLVH